MTSSDHKGLSTEQATAALARCGPNRLFTPAPVSFWHIAAEEMREPMILLLLAVGLLYSVWGELRDALTIVAIIVILVSVEVGNEFRAKRAIAALERIAAPQARVRRSGEVVHIDTERVVPNDILVLVHGTRIPADAELAAAMNLTVDESALTGEAFPVEKAVGDEVFAGTIVLGGEGEAEVRRTGAETRLGQTAAAVQRVKPPKTPLQVAMKQLAGKLVWVAVSFAMLIPLIGIARGGDPRQMVLTGLSLAFATIPEELPIIITMVLALGSRALSRQGFLVKRLRAAETLGDATVILTDKTGTLTESRLRVAVVYPAGHEQQVIAAALGTVSPESPDAIEQAVLEHAQVLGIGPTAHRLHRLRHVGNGRRSKAALWQEGDALRLYLAGAPEEVFERCRDVSAEMREALAAETTMGRRLIAVATRVINADDAERPFEDMERSLTLTGLISFADPPRPHVKETLSRLADAGIRTVMVTGDHPATAAAIAREVGIATERVLIGEDLDTLDDAVLAQTVRDVSVYARATPQHKYRLVQALQHNGDIVAVTGDGINDAIALKAADVGIAMGIKGTDVAKEAAQAVLADDNYVTIATGVFEGRKFFDNLRKGVRYYLSVKVGLIAIFLLPVLLGLPLPFSPVQIVLLELFMDLAASAGFVAEPAEEDIYRRWRRRPTALFGPAAIRDILLKGLLLFAAVMAAYALARRQQLAMPAVQTYAFTAWISGHVVLAFISRRDGRWTRWRSLFDNRVLDVWAVAALAFLIAAVYWPFLRDALHFETLRPLQLMFVGILAALIVMPAELRKHMMAPSPIGG